ncbi:AbiH family protein [Limosilactobacillus balticus]|nr:bacteriophage abortive infection AbiH family protein [Limosilactobacillus balticus]
MVRGKQLIILGNGFDLACGLKSSYTNFFNYSISKILKYNSSEDEISKMMKGDDHTFDLKVGDLKHGYKLKEINSNVKDYSVTFWDLYFLIRKVCVHTHLADNHILAWNDVESNIYYVLHLFSKSEKLSRYELSEPDKTIFDFIKSVLESEDFREYDGLPCDYLFDQLKIFEENFSKYIRNKVQSNDNYLTNATKKLVKLKDNNLTSRRVLSFNYSINKKDLSESLDSKLIDEKRYQRRKDLLNSIDQWRNIHGIAKEGYPSKEIIFGIDSDIVNKNRYKDEREYEKELQFTKTYRVAYNTDPSNQFIVSKDIKLITFYGHSLSSADYSYFESIFDVLDIYNSDVVLQFYIGTYQSNFIQHNNPNFDHEKFEQLFTKLSKRNNLLKRNAITNVYDLLRSYGETLNNNHGDNLLHKLLLENRIQFVEDAGAYRFSLEEYKKLNLTKKEIEYLNSEMDSISSANED